MFVVLLICIIPLYNACLIVAIKIVLFTAQADLSHALVDREALERLPDAALNRLDKLYWEKRRADGMVECRRWKGATFEPPELDVVQPYAEFLG